MAVAFVQAQANTSGSTGASVAKAWTVAPTAGNLIVALVQWLHSGTEDCTVADTLGNTYTPIAPTSYDATGTWVTQIFYAKNINGGSCTTTATLLGSRSFPGLTMHEVSGCDLSAPFDGYAHAENQAGTTGADAMSSGNATTSVDGAYLFGCMTQDGVGSPGAITAGTSYTLRTTDNTYGSWTESRVQPTAGAVAATFQVTSAVAKFVVTLAAFKPPVVQPPPSVPAADLNFVYVRR